MSRLVVYTVIYGRSSIYDTLIEPSYITPDCDYVCFTDQDFTSNVWQIRKMNPPKGELGRISREPKIRPHRHFPEYESSVYVDGNFIVRGDAHEFAEKVLEGTSAAFFSHKVLSDGRDCLYKEGAELIALSERGKAKDKKEVMEKQMLEYRKKGYPEQNGLVAGGIIVRRHNEPDCVQTMEDWWQEVKTKSKRDLLSFNYVAWKNNFSFSYINGNVRNNNLALLVPHKNNTSFLKRIKMKIQAIAKQTRNKL